MKLKVMSFNIRYSSSKEQDGQNCWENRYPYVSSLIQFYQPDICGLQEVIKHQLDDLSRSLLDYRSVGVGRLDGREEGEYVPIFYRSDNFQLLHQGHFWLSEEPHIAGSKSWDAGLERMATWAILEDHCTSQSFLVLNTHFDHLGTNSRYMSAILILKEIQNILDCHGPIPVFVMGDFNAEPTEDAIREITRPDNPLHLKNASTESPFCYGPNWTYHEFGQLACEQRILIDYIFTRNVSQIESYASLCESICGLYPSDHNPILVTTYI